MDRHNTPAAAMLATLACILAAPAGAQEPTEETPYIGAYQGRGVDAESWYYDYYESEATPKKDVWEGDWWSDTTWYSDEYYDGRYDGREDTAQVQDDWYFDSYQDPTDEGLFDL